MAKIYSAENCRKHEKNQTGSEFERKLKLHNTFPTEQYS